jgi:hypothetical protein
VVAENVASVYFFVSKVISKSFQWGSNGYR